MEKGKVHFLHQMKMVFISLMTITPMNLFATHRHVIGQLNPKNEVLLDKKGLSQCIFRQKWFKTYVQIVVRITCHEIVGYQQTAKQFYVPNIYDTLRPNIQ